MSLNVATLVARVIADNSGFNAGMAATESRFHATAESLKTTGRSLSMGVTLPIVAAAAASVDFANKFQAQMERVHTQAGVTQKKTDELSKAVLALAPSTNQGPEKLAAGMYHVASVMNSTGASTAQMMNVLKVAAQGAAVGGSNLEDTASALAGTMRVFHEPASAAAHTMGLLNAVVGAGNMKMQDLNNAIATGILPTARGLHLSIADVGAALATMTDESTPAQVAATRMRTAMLMMTGETKKSQKALADIHMTAQMFGHDLQQPDGLVVAMQDLHRHLQKLPDDFERTRAVAEIFGGARSSGTVMQWLNNLNMMHQKFDQINKTASNFPQDVIAQEATNSYKLGQAWSAVQTTMVTVGGILAPIVSQIAGFVAELALKFQSLNPHLQHLIVYGALIAAALGPVLWIIGNIMTAMEMLGGVIAALASPVGIIVVALAAVAVGFYELYQHSETFRKSISDLLTIVKGDAMAVFQSLENIISAIAPIFSGLGVTWQSVGEKMANVMHTLSNAVSVVAGFVADEFNKIATAIKSRQEEIRAAILSGWNIIESVTRAVWPVIEAVIKTAWDLIKITIDTTLKVIGNLIMVFVNVLQGHWSAAWQNIVSIAKDIFLGLWHSLVAIVQGLGPTLISVTLSVAHGVADALLAIGKFLVSLPGKLQHLVVSAITSVISYAASEAVHIGTAIVTGVLSGIAGLPGQLAHKLHSYISDAIGFAGKILHGSGDYQFTIHAVGEPMAEGIIKGLEQGLTGKLSKSAAGKIKQEITAVAANAAEIQHATTVLGHAATQGIIDGVIGKQESLAEQMKQSLQQSIQQAVQQAKQAAQTAMSSLMSTFNSTASSLLSTFESQTSAYVSPAQKQLSAMQLEDQVKQYQDAVTKAQSDMDSANKALTDAMSGGDPQKIADARQAYLQSEQSYYAAVRQQQEFNLQQTAAQQTAAYNKRRLAQEEHLAKTLHTLQVQLAKHPDEWRKTNEKILAVMKEYHIPMYDAGQKFIDEFKNGIIDQIPALEVAARAAAKAVAKYLKLHSPAEAGPLSDLDKWWVAFVPTLLKGFDPSGLAKVTAGVTSPSMSVVGANTSGGSTPPQNASHAPLVYIAEQHVHDEVDANVAAATIAAKVAFTR